MTLRRCVMAIEEGYAAASDYVNAIPFLRIESAFNKLQDFFNLAADYFLAEKCKQGIIPLQASFPLNVSNNYRHLELTSDGIVITLSSIRKPGEFPRYALFREQHASEQTSLYEDAKPDSSLYAILVHQRTQNKDERFSPKVQIGIPNTEYSYWEELFSLDGIPSISMSNAEIADDLESTITLKKNLGDIFAQGL